MGKHVYQIYDLATDELLFENEHIDEKYSEAYVYGLERTIKMYENLKKLGPTTAEYEYQVKYCREMAAREAAGKVLTDGKDK